MKPTWKPIPGYEGFYEISESGTVRSLDRMVDDRLRKGRTLKPRFDQRGKEYAEISKNGKKQRFVISLLLKRVYG